MAAEEQALPDGEQEARAGEARRPKAQLPGLPQRTQGNAHEGDGGGFAERTHPFSDALELVRAASEALERMRARCREVEAYASQQADYYRAELALAHTGMRELQQQTMAQEEGLRKLEDQLRSETEQRRDLEEMLKATTDMSERLQEQLREAENRALAAEAWLGRFQGEIASAFGEIPRILGEFGQSEDQQELNVVPLRQGG
jgi:chromosome segregation ATPase